VSKPGATQKKTRVSEEKGGHQTGKTLGEGKGEKKKGELPAWAIKEETGSTRKRGGGGETEKMGKNGKEKDKPKIQPNHDEKSGERIGERGLGEKEDKEGQGGVLVKSGLTKREGEETVRVAPEKRMT